MAFRPKSLTDYQISPEGRETGLNEEATSATAGEPIEVSR
jgi:hypothetical protein